MKQALKELGFTIGDQAAAELLIHEYARRNWQPIVDYCHSADAFQDIPFSLPYTYQILDFAFPGAKFILSMRSNEDEWYQSLVRFTCKRLKLDRKPTKDDCMNDTYRYKGFSWDSVRIVYNSPAKDPFEESRLKQFYRNHNQAVREYFRFRDNLLIINLGEQDSYGRFCQFLQVPQIMTNFPWLNKS